jgi:microcystin-dependent protein
MDALIGNVFYFSFDFAPRDGWLLCDGQGYSISQYRGLFDVIQNRFGGDGKQTFCVPNLNSAGLYSDWPLMRYYIKADSSYEQI